MASTRLVSGQQADFPANRSRSVRCVRQCRPLVAEWASTVSVRYDRCSVWLRSYLCDRAQYVKIGQHCCSRSPECRCSAMTGMAYCCLLCTDVVTHSMASSTTSISIRRYTATTVSSPVPLTLGRGTCSTPRGRIEAVVIGTSSHLQVATSTLSSVSVAVVDLPTADKMMILGVMHDRRLSVDSHATMVERAYKAVTKVGHGLDSSIHGLDWVGLDWIGSNFLFKNLDWIGLGQKFCPLHCFFRRRN